MRLHSLPLLLLLAISAAPAFAQSTGTIAFGQAAYSVDESGTVVVVNIVRTGDLTGTATANWLTSDGTAHVGEDYTAGAGSVTFAVGMAAATATVSILQDTEKENAQNFLINLTSPDTDIGTPSTATVTINDDDGGQTTGSSGAPLGQGTGDSGCGRGAVMPIAAGLMMLLALRQRRG